MPFVIGDEEELRREHSMVLAQGVIKRVRTPALILVRHHCEFSYFDSLLSAQYGPECPNFGTDRKGKSSSFFERIVVSSLYLEGIGDQDKQSHFYSAADRRLKAL